MKGIIFDIKRFAIHDGPGIRTTVFVKGCGMTCWWCHNPESRHRSRELSFYIGKCVKCGRCVEVCLSGVHRLEQQAGELKHVMDRKKCVLCGRCSLECPADALRVIGETRTAGDVFGEVLEDRHYYATSGGGMTVSGGEPLEQADFVYAICFLAKSEGIHTAVDTNGNNGREGYEKLAPVVDLFLFDIKQMDAQQYERHTSGRLDRVLENLRWLSDNQAEILLRCPIIPGLNASRR